MLNNTCQVALLTFTYTEMTEQHPSKSVSEVCGSQEGLYHHYHSVFFWVHHQVIETEAIITHIHEQQVSLIPRSAPQLSSPHTISDKKQWKRLAARLADFLQNIQ